MTAAEDVNPPARRSSEELRHDVLELQLRELQRGTKEKRQGRFNPAVLGAVGVIFAALIAAMGSVYVEYIKGRSDLIIQAIGTGSRTDAAKNLNWLVDAGFLSDRRGKIAKLLTEPNEGPVLPAPGAPGRVFDTPDVERPRVRFSLTTTGGQEIAYVIQDHASALLMLPNGGVRIGVVILDSGRRTVRFTAIAVGTENPVAARELKEGESASMDLPGLGKVEIALEAVIGPSDSLGMAVK